MQREERRYLRAFFGTYVCMGAATNAWVAFAPSHADFATRPFRIYAQHFAMVALRSLNGRAALCPLCCIP